MSNRTPYLAALLIAALLIAAVAGLWLHPVPHRFLAGRLYNNVGALYASGVFGENGGASALRWYRDAAALGCAPAAFNLGYAYQNGLGTAVDEREARRWYEQAADGGIALAANNLAMLYANPAHGRPRLALARLWLRRAAARAEADLAGTVAASLAAMERDMTPEQLAVGDDPERAARVDLPAPPRIVAPLGEAGVRTQVATALAAAAPLREAATRYIREHHQLPLPAVVASGAGFEPVDTATARVELGAGAMIQITLRGGPYDGADFGWIPLYQHGTLKWICAHGHVPTRYFGPQCR